MEERYLDFVYQPMRETDDTISGVLVLGVDVTERKRAQAALLQSEKLAAVGRLSASIAHEINNPLEAVTNLLYLINEEKDLPDQARSFTHLAQQELARVSQIATQTLRFYRQPTARTAVRVSEQLDSVLKLYQGRLLPPGWRSSATTVPLRRCWPLKANCARYSPTWLATRWMPPAAAAK